MLYPMLQQAGSLPWTHTHTQTYSHTGRTAPDGEMKTERKDSVVFSSVLPYWVLSHLVMCLLALCPML